MTNARNKVLELLAEGTVTADEAETLLAAMKPAPPTWRHAIGNPTVLGTTAAIVTGLLGAMAALALNLFQVRFDGPFDLHLADSVPPWIEAMATATINWLATAAALWASARVFAKRGGPLEMIALVGVGRIPMVLGGVAIAILAALGVPTDAASPTVMVWVMLGLVALGWTLLLLVRGFATVTGLRGGRLFAAIAVALVGTELIVKAVLLTLGWTAT